MTTTTIYTLVVNDGGNLGALCAYTDKYMADTQFRQLSTGMRQNLIGKKIVILIDTDTMFSAHCEDDCKMYEVLLETTTLKSDAQLVRMNEDVSVSETPEGWL